MESLVRRLGCGFAAVCLSAIAVGRGRASAADTPAASPARSSTPELLQPHLIDIGGRRLNLVCVGKGSPTVVFDLPILGNLLQWRKVMRPIAGIARACFFDRAGYDFSDPSSRPLTVANEAEDLHRTLKTAGIRGSIVLVGHSMGG